MKSQKKEEKKVDKKIDPIDETEALAGKLLGLMSVKADVVVTKDEENDAVLVNINAPESTGLLIGRQGETLVALQSILGMMVKQKVGEWVRIVVNVGDWREKQEDRLKGLARQAAERAIATGQPQPLYNLSASQRRVIHLELSEDTNVQTESVGEGVDRYLIVKPKANK
jgi:spoIIIJ-associated protein